MNLSLKVVILALLMFFSAVSYAQVGVNTESPNRLSELDVKNLVNGVDTIPKGIMIPRLRTEQRDLIDVRDASEGNGILIYNIDEDCYNYYNKLEAEWKSLCGKLGRAEFEITDCSAVEAYGLYRNKESLNTSHYIKMRVTVTKIGSYTIVAMPDPDNGYYFTLSGDFLTKGTFELLLPAAGTPIDYTPEGEPGDLIRFNLNGIMANCTINIPIEDSSKKPEYTMNCGKAKVNGIYLLDKELDGTNTLSLTITASVNAIGATYIIETDEQAGIKFSGSGILVNGTQVVTLQGVGTPNSVEPVTLTISSNSTISKATCSVSVPVAYTKKKILTIGSFPNGYGYNFSGTAQSGRMLKASNNYGTLSTSIVKCEGFDIIDGGADPSDARLYSWLLGAEPVDIVIIGFLSNYIGSGNQGTYIRQYLENGGVVLAYMDSNGAQAQPLLRAVFDSSSITAGNITSAIAGLVFNFSNVDHEILNGPFGDIRGLYWGEDASYTQGAVGLPTDKITIFSTDQDLAGYNTGRGDVTAFVHNELNFVYVGDGGFNSSDTSIATPYIICPFKVDANNSPIARQGYGWSTTGRTYPVYNSIFTANAIAWAIKKAQFKDK